MIWGISAPLPRPIPAGCPGSALGVAEITLLPLSLPRHGEEAQGRRRCPPHSDPHSLPCSSQRPRPHCASSLRKPRAGSSTGGTSRAVFTLCWLLAQPWPCSPTSPWPSKDRQGPCPPGSWAPGAPLPQPAAAGSALRSNPPGEEQSQGLRHKCWGQISSPGGTGTSSRGAAAAASRAGRSAGRGQENPQQRAQCTAEDKPRTTLARVKHLLPLLHSARGGSEPPLW